MIQDKGGNTPQYLAEYTGKFIEEAKKRPEIASISTMFQADVPQKAISIDNDKVLSAGFRWTNCIRRCRPISAACTSTTSTASDACTKPISRPKASTG